MFLAAIASVTSTAEVIATYCYTETQKKKLATVDRLHCDLYEYVRCAPTLAIT